MSNDQRPSLIRQIAPAAVLTAAGVAFVSLLDNPTGTNTVSLDLGEAAGQSTTVPLPPTTLATPETTLAPLPEVTTTLAPSPETSVLVPQAEAPAVDAAGACDGDLVTSPTALFRWGGIQLQVHFTRTNAICDVEVLQYPNDRSKSIVINENALPTYNAEAVAANSAQISAVSGATDSWEAYTAALQAVIDSRS
ncbi:MAG: FMN-binding protein [Actinomycetota bacterium]